MHGLTCLNTFSLAGGAVGRLWGLWEVDVARDAGHWGWPLVVDGLLPLAVWTPLPECRFNVAGLLLPPALPSMVDSHPFGTVSQNKPFLLCSDSKENRTQPRGTSGLDSLPCVIPQSTLVARSSLCHLFLQSVVT